LNEIFLGQWDGMTFEEVKRQSPKGFKQRGEHLDTFRPPGGESFVDLQNRVLPFFHQCLREPGTPLFVTHAGVIRVILCHVTGLALKDLFQISMAYGQLFVLERPLTRS
jgi:alpha-ribazole phosphatase